MKLTGLQWVRRFFAAFWGVNLITNNSTGWRWVDAAFLFFNLALIAGEDR